jgi:hypothetical protein
MTPTEGYREAGLDAARRGDWNAAADLLNRYLAGAPHDAAVHYSLASVYVKCGTPDYAMQVVDRLVGVQPQSPDAHYYRGAVLHELGRTQEAIAEYQRALQCFPAHAGASQALQGLGVAVGVPASGPAAYPAYPPHPGVHPPGFGPRNDEKSFISLMVWGVIGLAGLIAAAAGGVLQWKGSQDAREAARFAKPQVVTYAQFVKQKPKEGWFRVKDCVVAPINPTYEWRTFSRHSTGGYISDVWIPVYARTDRDLQRPGFYVHTENATHTEHAKRISELSHRDENDPEIERYVKQHEPELLVLQDVEGMIETGYYANEADRDDIARLNKALPADVIIIDEGRRPNVTNATADQRNGRTTMWVGFAVLGLAAVLALLSLRREINSR